MASIIHNFVFLLLEFIIFLGQKNMHSKERGQDENYKTDRKYLGEITPKEERCQKQRMRCAGHVQRM